MIFNNALTPEQLDELFRNDEKCLQFLADIKWANGFACNKCGNSNWCAGKEPFSRRCTRCKTKESATNGTIFHGVKFPISKAFYIAYQVCKGHTELSTYELGRRLALRQMTCWNFKTKIQKALSDLQQLTDKEKGAIERMLTT
jgi:hypothetical protein